MTKRQESIIARYERSTRTDLWDCYTTCSAEKRAAWKNCVKSKLDHNGDNLRVIGANGWQFSVGYTFEQNGKTYLMYITKNGEEIIPYEEV